MAVRRKIIKRPAIVVTQNIPKPFYAFSLRASELREIAYVSERTKQNPEEGIERNLNQARCKKIGRYIKHKTALFPNSIIVALDKSAKFRAKGDSPCGSIEIPFKPSQALILDGQHRLYGFDYAESKDMELLIVAFIGIPIDLKAHIFRMINGEQKPVNRSLVFDLLDLDTSTVKFEEERAHALVKELEKEEESPFYHDIQMTGRREEGFISQASLITYLKPFFRKNGLFREEGYSTFNRQIKLLIDYFKAVRDTFPSDWGSLDSVLTKTAGINAFFRLLRDAVPLMITQGKKPEYKTFLKFFESLSDYPLDVETHKKYGTGGAIALHEELKGQLGLNA